MRYCAWRFFFFFFFCFFFVFVCCFCFFFFLFFFCFVFVFFFFFFFFFLFLFFFFFFFLGGWGCACFSSFRISLFRLFCFRLTCYRYFVFSLGVISSLCRAITPGEKTKKRNKKKAQTSHHICEIELSHIGNLKTTDIPIWFSRIFPSSGTKYNIFGKL